MKKISNLSLLFAAAGCFAGTAVFPLEWNVNRRTDTPYEVEIDRNKLAEISDASADCGFKVFAEVKGKRVPLDVQLIPGREAKLVSLRFNVPEGTDKLECETSGKGEVTAVTENVFAGILDKANLKKWNLTSNLKVSSTANGILLQHSGMREGFASYTVDIPEGMAGKAVRMEFDVKSLTALPWSNNNRIEQLDTNGKLIPEGAVRQEWISHVRPCNVLTQYRENGRIHPDAKKLRLSLRIITPLKGKRTMGIDGLPIKSVKDAQPSLEISHLALRAAEQLPFPKFNDEFFVPGVSGKPGDYAIRLSQDNHFSHSTATQAVWGDATQVRDPRNLHFPVGAEGTVEFYIKPDKWKYARRNSVVLIDAYNLIGMAGPKMIRREAIFELRYRPVKRELTLTLKDGKDNIFKEKAKAELTANKWTHVAAQWSSDGVKLFVDGKMVMNNTNFKFVPLDIAKMPHPNAYIPMQVTLGTHTMNTRNTGKFYKGNTQDFYGAIDLMRHSDVARYSGDFTPAKEFSVDEATRALIGFDRTYNGVSGTGTRFLDGALRATAGMTDRYLEVNGNKKVYIPLTNQPYNDPGKVLDSLNYPVLPETSDFHAARKREVKVLNMSVGKDVEFELPENVYTDYVEIVNTNKDKDLVAPVVINEGEVDCRSYADIAESLKLAGKPDRWKIEELFRFILARSDYYMTHQAYIPDGNDHASTVENYPLAMLNGYCGFECGPLNLLTAALFTASGNCPSRVIGAYAHAYEGVFYDSRSRIFDLASQKFFPSWDNVNAATQDEIDIEPGLMHREKSNPNHFMRLTTRGGGYMSSVGTMPKSGVTVKPQERLRIYSANDGIQNDLQCDGRVNGVKVKFDKTDETGIIVQRHRMYRVDRFFPHVSTGLLSLDCVPAENKAAFTDISKNSFCYKVVSSYPVVRGNYFACDKNGKPIKMTFITCGGKRQRTFEMTSDGRYELDYEVRARYELLFRVEAPIGSVAKFSAETQFIRNPRIFTGKLRKGKNKLAFKEVNNSSAKISIGYRENVKPITIDGGVYTGTITGFERQLFVAEPGKTSTFKVNGASNSAKLTAYGNVSAEYADGNLKITPADGPARFAEVVINDNGAEKAMTLLVGKGVRLLTAKDFVPGNAAVRVKADKSTVQDCVMIKDNGRCKVKFDKIPAGKYAVWNLNRFESHIASIGLVARPLNLSIPGAKREVAAGSAINHASDFYKAQYGRKGGRSRFKWDFPIDPASNYWWGLPQTLDLPECSEMTFKCVRPDYKGIELAAVLIVPDPSIDLRNDMMKILSGINCEPFLRNK